jgi:hypothetical protein
MDSDLERELWIGLAGAILFIIWRWLIDLREAVRELQEHVRNTSQTANYTEHSSKPNSAGTDRTAPRNRSCG